MGRKQLVLMVFASLAMIGLLSALSQTALAGESISQTKKLGVQPGSILYLGRRSGW